MAIGIIGGSGVYDPKVLEDVEELPVQKTPYGDTSDKITKGKMFGKEVFIIPRHGHDHKYNPSTVPYRANIHALKELGVTKILTVSAVGSLKQEMKPGDFVFTDHDVSRTDITVYDPQFVCSYQGIGDLLSNSNDQGER